MDMSLPGGGGSTVSGIKVKLSEEAQRIEDDEYDDSDDEHSRSTEF